VGHRARGGSCAHQEKRHGGWCGLCGLPFRDSGRCTDRLAGPVRERCGM